MSFFRLYGLYGCTELKIKALKKIARIRAENRVNLSAEIWRRRKIAVPLHRDSKHRVPDAAFNNTHTQGHAAARYVKKRHFVCFVSKKKLNLRQKTSKTRQL